MPRFFDNVFSPVILSTFRILRVSITRAPANITSLRAYRTNVLSLSVLPVRPLSLVFARRLIIRFRAAKSVAFF